jgi:hypothetical protein
MASPDHTKIGIGIQKGILSEIQIWNMARKIATEKTREREENRSKSALGWSELRVENGYSHPWFLRTYTKIEKQRHGPPKRTRLFSWFSLILGAITPNHGGSQIKSNQSCIKTRSIFNSNLIQSISICHLLSIRLLLLSNHIQTHRQ